MQKNSVQEPAYIRYEDSEREQLLSGLGTFTPVQRELFRRLCSMWEPEIDYERFIKVSSSHIDRIQNELANLMKKLRSSGFGLITTEYENEERKNKKIILTDEKELRFYFYLIKEEYEDVKQNPLSDFPSRESLEEKKIRIPDHYINSIEMKDLDKSYKADEMHILEIATVEGGKFLAVSSELKTLVPVLIKKIREHLSINDFLEEIARIRSTMLSDIKKRLQSRDPLVWFDLNKTILTNRKKIKTNQKLVIHDSFFQAAHFLAKILEIQIQEARESRRINEEMQQDWDKIEETVRQNKETVLDQLELTAILDSYNEKYKNDFEKFKEGFYEHTAKTKERRNLPPILFIDGAYIHQDHVFTEFLVRFKEMEPRLRSEYISMMDTVLRSNNRDGINVFYSRRNFRDDVLNRIAVLDPLLSSFLEHPGIIAEAMIHKLKLEGRANSPSDIKILLSEYFESERMVFRDPLILFNLNSAAIFESAFAHLPLWRQIWMKLSGKYESFRESYESAGPSYSEIRRVQRSKEKADSYSIGVSPGRSTATTSTAGPDRDGPSGRKEVKLYSREEALSLRKKRKPTVKVKRSYSRKDQEDAWKNFGESLRKNRGS